MERIRLICPTRKENSDPEMRRTRQGAGKLAEAKEHERRERTGSWDQRSKMGSEKLLNVLSLMDVYQEGCMLFAGPLSSLIYAGSLLLQVWSGDHLYQPDLRAY